MKSKAHLSILRKPALAVLKMLNRDITIQHHWSKRPLLLNLYHHKGYWYHGRERERSCIEGFYRLISKSDTVLEVGGHIGYLTQIFAGLASKVIVFEPGKNNLSYLRKNVSQLENVTLVEKAVSNENGFANFYLDPLTGQNNSLLKDYDVYAKNSALAVNKAEAIETKVEVVRLDDFCAQNDVVPTFVKIDVEGAELGVLQGMERVLKEHRPKIMIEVSANIPAVEQLLRSFNYQLLDENGAETHRIVQLDNLFAIPRA